LPGEISSYLTINQEKVEYRETEGNGAQTLRVQVRYSGRVQGVGFRATAASIAGRHPVTGWVRNEPDGDVLMQAQGDAAAIEAMLTDLRRTMERYIRSEDRSPIEEAQGEHGFQITR
jgi:acylphosphatase